VCVSEGLTKKRGRARESKKSDRGSNGGEELNVRTKVFEFLVDVGKVGFEHLTLRDDHQKGREKLDFSCEQCEEFLAQSSVSRPQNQQFLFVL